MPRGLTGRLWVIRLVDAYGRVLTAHQQRLLHLHYLDDLSLGEIAERLHVTRQAVFDSLRRSVHELERIEVSVGLVKGRQRTDRRRRQMHTRLEALEHAVSNLRGQVRSRTLTRIATALAAMRRAIE